MTYTLILIPGLLSDARVWQPLADRATGPVLQADVTRDLSIPDMAAALLGQVDGDVIAVGHSMGARVAMEMAHQAPDRVKGLVLANTGHHPLKVGEAAKREAKIAAGHQDFAAMVKAWLPPMMAASRHEDTALVADLTEMALGIGPEIHERQIRALVARPDAAAYLPRIACPVLLLSGTEDIWSPPSQHHEIADLLSDAEVEVVENAGHFLPVEQPLVTVNLIQGWLMRQAPRPAIPDTPLYDRAGSIRGYRLNKMAMALGTEAGRAAFLADEPAFLDSYGLDAETKAAVLSRNWQDMVRLGGNLFYILKISAVDPTPIVAIGAAQAGMSPEEFIRNRLGK